MSIEDDRIEKLKRKLYSRASEPVIDVRSQMRDNEPRVTSAWGENEELHIPDDMRQHTTHPVLKKFLFGAVLFFILSVAVSVFVFYGGGNLISSSNVDIKIAGPSIVASGEEINLAVSLINQNRTDLKSVRFSVDYPDGAAADKETTSPLVHTSETIDSIGSGSSMDKSIKLYLLGDKGSVKTITFKLEYEIAGSNAVFSKEKKYDITIGSSPVILNVSAPEEVSAGQMINFTTTITSNSPSVLKNVTVLAEYPYGFTFDSASARGEQSNTLWNLGDLKSGDKKTFTLSGKLLAQDGEQRVFKFSVGTKSADASKDIDTVLSQSQVSVNVTKPFLSAQLLLQQDDAPFVVVSSGNMVTGSIDFTNSLPDQIRNLTAVVTLNGSAFDRNTVQAGSDGFYQSSDNSIHWDKNTVASLSELNAGESGHLNFSFGTAKLPVSAKNPIVNVSLQMRGTRANASSASSDVTVSINKQVKVGANLSLVAKSLVSGAFANTGAHPPRVDKPSTYIVDWSLSNTWNDISGAKVSTQLPPYVEWTGQVSPQTANVVYNPDSRTVVWTPDSVSAGAGYTSAAKEVAFQVKITPSLSQVGTTPALTSDVSVSGTDTFTNKTITFTSPGVSTFTSDGGVSSAVIK